VGVGIAAVAGRTLDAAWIGTAALVDKTTDEVVVADDNPVVGDSSVAVAVLEVQELKEKFAVLIAVLAAAAAAVEMDGVVGSDIAI